MLPRHNLGLECQLTGIVSAFGGTRVLDGRPGQTRGRRSGSAIRVSILGSQCLCVACTHECSDATLSYSGVVIAVS